VIGFNSSPWLTSRDSSVWGSLPETEIRLAADVQ
jgi:hypothetical protein